MKLQTKRSEWQRILVLFGQMDLSLVLCAQREFYGLHVKTNRSHQTFKSFWIFWVDPKPKQTIVFRFCGIDFIKTEQDRDNLHRRMQSFVAKLFNFVHDPTKKKGDRQKHKFILDSNTWHISTNYESIHAEFSPLKSRFFVLVSYFSVEMPRNPIQCLRFFFFLI